MDEFIYTWKFSDIKQRSSLWYILAIAVVIGLAAWGIFTAQYGLTFITILGAGVLFFIENNTPDEVEVFLSDIGIKVDTGFYEYSKIKSYSYVFHEEQPIQLELNIEKKGLKTLRVPVNKEVYNELQNILPQFIEEGENLELSNMEKIINFLKL